MRRIPIALVVALLAGGLVAAPSQAAESTAGPGPKVVIVVGATHGTTPQYRSNADAAYAVAREYTDNVVKVYSPNATWSAVKSAMQGANIVIYMGHGNGFPSPYRTTPWPLSQNGFGLNAKAGQGDYNNQYYGEQYIANEVQLAPNAIVLLHHLCYASGNSEPGYADPSLSVAKQRADNYAAGFLAAGAAAVIAEGHRGPEAYLRALFETDQTLDEMWRSVSYAHGNEFSFNSSRTPGALVQMDPDKSSGGYYRAISGRMQTRTQEITGTNYVATGGDPADFIVPGAASVTPTSVPVYATAAPLTTPDSATAPSATLARNARLRILEDAGTGLDGGRVFRIQALDSATTGYVSSFGLKPRDSFSPNVWTKDLGVGAISPNGDGNLETVVVKGRFSESVSWRVRVRNGGGTIVFEKTGSGQDYNAAWDGRANGAAVPDGTYSVSIWGQDSWANPPVDEPASILVDTVAPQIDAVSLRISMTPETFTPNGDGVNDTIALGVDVSEAGTLKIQIRNAAETVVRTLTGPVTTAGSLTWDGKDDAGKAVADGRYGVRYTVTDGAANTSEPKDRVVSVYRALSAVTASPTVFYPQDGDSRAPTAVLSATLSAPARLTWTIQKPDGTVVYSRYDEDRPAGTDSFTWNGRGDDGAYVAPGVYVSSVRATDGAMVSVQRATIVADAFWITPNDTTPSRGQSITVTAVSAETLSTTPTLGVYDTGATAWTVTMTSLGSNTWRATVTMPSGVSPGNVRFRVQAKDSGGNTQFSDATFPLG